VCQHQCIVPLSKSQKAAAKRQEKERQARQRRGKKGRAWDGLSAGAERRAEQRAVDGGQAKARAPQSDGFAQSALRQQQDRAVDGRSSRLRRRIRRIGMAGAAGLVVLVPLVVLGVNYFGLQTIMNNVLSRSENAGIKVSVHYGGYLDGDILLYDLRSVAANKSMADVFRVLLQFAESMQSEEFETIKLCFRGNTKFEVDGDYFRSLEREYALENPVYTIRTFPQHLKTANGRRAFPPRLGGWLYVLRKQVEDFSEFHRQWYLGDLTRDADLGAYADRLREPQARPEVPSGNTSTLAPQAESFELIAVNTRMTQANEFIRQYAWKLTVRSSTAGPLALDAEIKFLDADGFLLHRDFALDMHLPAYKEEVFTGAVVMTPDVGRRVASAKAIVRPR
jgi:hypothetical protein